MEFNGTFLATIITFIVFVFLMNKVLYVPVLDIMEKRKNFVDENYKNAQENNSKTEEPGREKEERLAGAKDDARGKYVSILDDFKNRKSDVIREAQNSAQDELNKAQGELDNLSNEVKEGLKGRMNELAGDIAEKILGYRSDINGFDDDTVNRVLYH